MICTKKNRNCYALFRQHTKPKSVGGLAFVMVTHDDGTKHPLLGCTELETTLLEYSQTHFASAEGSPFTQEPLARLLQYDGLTPFGDRVTNGRHLGNIHTFDEPMQAILDNLCRKTQANEQPTTLDHEKLLEGIKNGPNGLQCHHLDGTSEFTKC